MHNLDAVAVCDGQLGPLRSRRNLTIQLNGNPVRAQLEPLQN